MYTIRNFIHYRMLEKCDTRNGQKFGMKIKLNATDKEIKKRKGNHQKRMSYGANQSCFMCCSLCLTYMLLLLMCLKNRTHGTYNDL